MRHVVSAPAAPRRTGRGSQLQKTLETMVLNQQQAPGGARKTMSLRTAPANITGNESQAQVGFRWIEISLNHLLR